MNAYDPNVAPLQDAWLALSEWERISLVEDFHRQAGDFGENLKLHASMHVVVENQLALGEPAETRNALSRLVSEGLNRHDALHAVASVLCEYIFPILKSSQSSPATFDAGGYAKALARLSSASWRGDC